jgi:hypothetical protein
VDVSDLFICVEFVVFIALVRARVVLDFSVFVFRFVLVKFLLLDFEIVPFGFDLLMLLRIPE